MRERVLQKATAAKAIGLGICALLTGASAARACDYHWALGIPEPTGIWPSQQTTDANLSMAAATSAALADLDYQETINDAAITSWMQNVTNKKGHSPNATINNLVSQINADVQTVAYNATDVYIHATGVPSHDVGPFTGNPAYPSDRNRTFRLPRAPVAQGGTKTAVGLGPVGVMVNGVPFFDPRDAQSYNNQNIWHQNANVYEASSFDGGPGHPVPDMASQTTPKTGAYHYHQAPLALLNQLDPGNTGQHASPLLGFAFDGFPVYGPYGATNSDGTGSIIRMTSSYYLPSGVTTRTNGPTIAQVSQGSYVEDYVYSAGLGTLDQYNGRFEMNSDYPQGTYAYHVALNAAGTAVYPYIIGPSYYGVVQTANLGMGTITVPGDVTYYVAPEPSSLALIGLVGAMLLKRKRR
jgi:hypothetical protein